MPNSTKGFASMTPERRSEIARLGGKAAHALGVAHKWDSLEAMHAGRKAQDNIRKRRGLHTVQREEA